MTDRDDAQQIAREVIRQHYAMLGIDIGSIQALQEHQADLSWVRRYRRLSERIGSVVLLTVITILTGAMLKVLWDGLQGRFGAH